MVPDVGLEFRSPCDAARQKQSQHHLHMEGLGLRLWVEGQDGNHPKRDILNAML